MEAVATARHTPEFIYAEETFKDSDRETSNEIKCWVCKGRMTEFNATCCRSCTHGKGKGKSVYNGTPVHPPLFCGRGGDRKNCWDILHSGDAKAYRAYGGATTPTHESKIIR